MKLFSALIIGGTFLMASSCTAQNNGFQSTPDGLEYKYITKGDGTISPKVGDFAVMNLTFKIGDSLLINTLAMNEGKPVTQQVQASRMKGDLMEGLQMMKAGDSIEFRMLMDTLSARAGQPKPEWTKAGDYATWNVKMVEVKTKEQMEKETAEKSAAEAKKEDSVLQAYFKKNGIKNAQKTASGLYYVIHKEGTGENPKAGQKVTVNYTGRDLNGKKFDSNVDSAFHHVAPFDFVLDQHRVIAGWDEGVALLKKGSKATFYIPSVLAYGERGAGAQIPPNSILIFDIELLNIQ